MKRRKLMYIERRLRKMTVILFIIIIFIIILLKCILEAINPTGLMDDTANFIIKILRFLFKDAGVALDRLKNSIPIQ